MSLYCIHTITGKESIGFEKLGLELKVTLVFSLLVRGGRETTAPELSSKATISVGFTNCRYLY